MSEFWEKAREDLSEPFPLEDIEFRVGSRNKEHTRGLLLAYVSARAIMNRLDDVFGIENWEDEYERWSIEKGNLCRIKARIPEQLTKKPEDGDYTLYLWVTKCDGADDSDMEAFKGGVSNAFKRTAVKWGIGRYLYNLPQWWVMLKNEKYPADGEEDRIRAEFPEWALPKDYKNPWAKQKPKPKSETQQKTLFEKAVDYYNTNAKTEEELRIALALHGRGLVPEQALADAGIKKRIKIYADPKEALEFSRYFSAGINLRGSETAGSILEEMAKAGIHTSGDMANYIQKYQEIIEILNNNPGE